jgi:hypothetical protein
MAVSMAKRIAIHQAGNTLVPVLAALDALGFRVWYEPRNSGDDICCAENDQFSISAYDPFALLGLAKMLEVRGENWMPTNAEIERFLKLDGTST